MRNPIAVVVKRIPSAYHSHPELGKYSTQTIYSTSFNQIDSWYFVRRTAVAAAIRSRDGT